MQHLYITDRGCVLCHAEYQQSSTNLPRESKASLNSIHAYLKRAQNPRHQSEYYYPRNHPQLQQYIPINVEQLPAKPSNKTYSSMAHNVERNTLGYYTDDIIGTSDYEQFRDQNNFREERMKDAGKQRHQPSSCNLLKKGNGDSYIYETKINGQITAECSRRPIRCPRIDCAINVAFSALTHHFIFDHPEVPILNVEPGIKSTLIVSFNALSSNSSRCLALLLVSGKLS